MGNFEVLSGDSYIVSSLGLPYRNVTRGLRNPRQPFLVNSVDGDLDFFEGDGLLPNPSSCIGEHHSLLSRLCRPNLILNSLCGQQITAKTSGYAQTI